MAEASESRWEREYNFSHEAFVAECIKGMFVYLDCALVPCCCSYLNSETNNLMKNEIKGDIYKKYDKKDT